MDPFEQFVAEFAGFSSAMAIAKAAGIECDVLASLLEVEALMNAVPQDRVQARMPYTIRLY